MGNYYYFGVRGEKNLVNFNRHYCMLISRYTQNSSLKTQRFLAHPNSFIATSYVIGC